MIERTLTSADWRVAGKPDGTPPEEGKLYKIRHARKGAFTGRILSTGDEWAEVEITDGTAHALCDYNVREVGEEVTIRACMSHFTEIEG